MNIILISPSLIRYKIWLDILLLKIYHCDFGYMTFAYDNNQLLIIKKQAVNF